MVLQSRLQRQGNSRKLPPQDKRGLGSQEGPQIDIITGLLQSSYDAYGLLLNGVAILFMIHIMAS